jgi:hypothetical protein
MIKTTIINLAIVFYLFFAWSWDLSADCIARKLIAPFKRIILFSGLWHTWKLFAPQPISVNLKLHAVIHMAGGDSVLWSPMDEARGLGSRRFSIVRERKWQRNLLTGKNRSLKISLCQYLTSCYKGLGQQPTQIVLIKSCRRIPPPGAAPEAETHMAIYVYDALSGTQVELNHGPRILDC